MTRALPRVLSGSCLITSFQSSPARSRGVGMQTPNDAAIGRDKRSAIIQHVPIFPTNDRLANVRPAYIPSALCYNRLHSQTCEVHMEYPVVLEQDPEAGGYVVSCPTLKGCVSQGETEEEALDNIKDAIKTYLESIEDLKRLKKLRTVEVSA